MASHELLQGLIEAMLASSAAILLVLALRRPLRRLFGAGVAYALWLLVPAALLASLLPAATVVAERVPVAQVLVLQVAMAAVATPADGIEWSGPLLGLWMAGALACGLWLWRAQRGFRRGLGHLLPHGQVLRAQSVSAGLPATLGLWRPQVVLPADFEARFDAAQRELMLAHERCHIARRDPWVNGAVALLRCLFWCNPLVHLAGARLRHDQELACDAAVLAEYPQQRRAYGDALLHAQLALQTVPLGCHFGFGHPLKERIVMLRQTEQSSIRRFSGAALVAVLGCGVALAAWAAQPATVVPNAGTIEITQETTQGAASAKRASALQPGQVDAQSRQLNPPVYPADALEEGKVGTTVMVVDVDAHGVVMGAKVERSSGDARLDSAALSAVAKWKFHPESKGGKPVASKVRVPVMFALPDSGKSAG